MKSEVTPAADDVNAPKSTFANGVCAKAGMLWSVLSSLPMYSGNDTAKVLISVAERAITGIKNTAITVRAPSSVINAAFCLDILAESFTTIGSNEHAITYDAKNIIAIS